MAQEFYINDRDKLMISGESGAREYCESDRDFTDHWYERIANDWPDALDELAVFFKKRASNARYFRFCVVEQFLSCRFGQLDNHPDIDAEGRLHQEHQICPIRRHCPLKRIPCECSITNKLSESEFEVLKMIYNGLSEMEIAELRGTSVLTVRTQARNGRYKLGVGSTVDFVIYATRTELFNNK